MKQAFRSGWICTAVLALFAAGCASTGDQTQSTATGTAPGQQSRYKLADGRTVEIGKATPADGGLSYKNPHLEKCWIADGFDFNGYDTLYISPTINAAKYNPKDEEMPLHAAQENLVAELKRALTGRGLFVNVVTSETDLKPGTKVLKLQNTIIEYAKGGGAARYFAGLYGAGQPVLRVQGKLAEGDKQLFAYEARRSGVSAGARMTGAFMTDVDIQHQDIQSMVLDLTDFIAIVSKKAPLRN